MGIGAAQRVVRMVRMVRMVRYFFESTDTMLYFVFLYRRSAGIIPTGSTSSNATLCIVAFPYLHLASLHCYVRAR